MSNSLINGTVTLGGTAQDALPARLGRSNLIITALDGDLWVNFSETAAVDNGELILAGSFSEFTIWKFPEVGGLVSILGTTTGDRYTIRDI